MKLKVWMIAKAVICALFGLVFVLAPTAGMNIYAIKLDDAGIFMTRLLGSSFIVLAIFLWMMRGVESPHNRKAICWAVFVGDLVGAVVALMGQLSGIGNALGWSTVVIYLALALGFGYFLLPH